MKKALYAMLLIAGWRKRAAAHNFGEAPRLARWEPGAGMNITPSGRWTGLTMTARAVASAATNTKIVNAKSNEDRSSTDPR